MTRKLEGKSKYKRTGAEFRRVLLLVAGFLCTGLAVIGIFLPLLPTVPLLLLAAACFARSSERFHRWLLEHRILGPLIRDYLDGRGVPVKAKVSALVMIWISIPTAALLFVPLVAVRILLLIIALAVTVYILRLPVKRNREN